MKKMILLIASIGLIAGLAGADTVTNTVGGNTGFPANSGGKAYLLSAKTLDLSSVTVASNDTVQVINVPANSIVLSVQYRVTDGTSTNYVTTFDIGDGTDPDGYASNISSTNEAGWATSQLAYTVTTTELVNTTDGWTNDVVTAVSATGYTDGKLYTDADTIDIHFDGAPGASGKIDVSAVVVQGAK